MTPEVQMFYPAINSAASLKAFYQLNPPLFRDYTREIKQVWRGYVGKAKNGNLLDKTWGKPLVTLTFGKVSRAEFAYFVTLKGVCTLRCRNEDTNAFHNYNAKLGQVTAGELTKSGDMYESLTAEFIELTQL